MSKNIFDETTKRIDIFDTLRHTKSIHHCETDINLARNNPRRSISSNFENNHHKPSSFKEIHETTTTSKTKNRVQIQEPTEHVPAMYKIAMRIKKLTEEKLLKKYPSQESSTSNNSKEEPKASILTRKQEIEDINFVLNEDKLLINEIVEFNLDENDLKKLNGMFLNKNQPLISL
jgi:hypothetical protein